MYPVDGFAPIQAAPSSERVKEMEGCAQEVEALGERLASAAAASESLVGSTCLSDRSGEGGSLAEVLVATELCGRLGPLLHDRYFVDFAFVPALLRLQGSATGGLVPLVRLLAVCLEEHELAALVEYSLTRLSMLCRTAFLRAPDFFRSSSVLPLQVAEALLSDDSIMYLFTDSSYAYPLLEGFLVFKQPNANDLAPIFPKVWWKGCQDDDGCDKDLVEERYQQVLEAAEAVEDAQMSLFKKIMHSKNRNYPPPYLPRMHGTFVGFFAWLAEKNKGVTRNVQPPGLSENSVLLSAYGMLLRVLYPQFQRRPGDAPDVCLGPQFRTFHPEVLTDLLVSKTAQHERRGGLPLYGDIARFGGTFSHVEKELKEEREGRPDQWRAQVAPLVLERESVESAPCELRPSGEAVFENPDVAEGYVGCVHRKHLGRSSEVSNRGNEADSEEEAVSMKRKLVQPHHSLTRSSLFSLMVLLYHLGMNTNFKNASYQLLIQRSAISQLEDMNQRIARAKSFFEAGEEEQAEAQVKNLKETRRLFCQDVVDAVRQCYWHKAVIYQPWRLKAIFHACGQTARLISGLSKRGNVFKYVPEAYMESMVDSFHTLRRGESVGQFVAMPDLKGDTLDDIITCLVLHFGDDRVLNPDVKDIILQSINMTLHHSEFLHAFERNDVAKIEMVPKLLDSFGPRFWIPVSNVLIRLCRGEGLGENPFKSSSSVMKGSFCDAYFSHPSSFSGFLTKLFNMLNWTATELTVTLKELVAHTQGRDRLVVTVQVETQQYMRKCSVMFELMCNLLRILEFISVRVPEAFVTGADKEMNVSRLVETISFVLSHTTAGSDSDDFRSVLALAEHQGGRSRFSGPDAELEFEEYKKVRSALDKVTQSAVVAPLAGVLYQILYRGTRSVREEVREGSRMVLAAICESGTLPSETLRFLSTAPGDKCFGECEAPPASAHLEQLREAIEEVLTQREAYASRQAAQGDETEDIPDDFLDPIQCTLMRDPVTLPDSGVVLDRSTIKRHLLCDPSDPFSRAALTIDQVTPNKELKDRISSWAQETNQDRRRTL